MRPLLHITFLFALLLIVARCTDRHHSENDSPATDTLAPLLVLRGPASDTAYIHTRYIDPGVSVLEGTNEALRCPAEPATVVVSGTVDTHLPGSYELVYDACDQAGNQALPVKRTVHVVEHRASNLAGNYNVVCTCTAIPKSGASTFTTTNYTTTLHPSPDRDQMELTILNTGGEDVSPTIILRPENKVDIHYYTRNMHSASRGTGTLTPSSQSYTFETVAYQYQPDITYRCKQVFTRQLILAETKTEPGVNVEAR